MVMDGALVEQKACEILIAPQCDSSDNEQGSFCNSPKKPYRKRKRESLSGVKGSYSPARQIPWCIGFTSARASESESELSEPSSTVYIVKGYESAVTAIVTDSEDDLFFLNETVEYEPPDSDSEEAEEDEDEDDDEDEEVIISSDEEDPGAEGGDEYEGESDSEIDEDDLWACSQCNLKNHPMSRQCARCWTERHEWLPHLKRMASEPAMDLSRVTDTPTSPLLQKSSSLAVAPTIENPCSSSFDLSTLKQQPETRQALSAESTEQTVTQHSENKHSASAFTPDLCVICLTQPRNASIVHGRTGHQVCCIGCAERLKEGKKKCPVCRKKIKLVVKNFF
ncbi:E3 ubiquitin-protein ligase Mdm2-like isoform X2 [Oculina patagonica]